MNDDQLLRYSRHIMLPQMGIEGQQALADAHVLIIGLGGLGSPAALYLAGAGVGQLTLVDDDSVELSNLQRQIIHHQHNIGERKVASAKSNLLAINPDIDIVTIDQRLNEAALAEQVQRADIILDASDNFATRFAINRACVQHKKPLVSGAAIQFEGQISVFDSRDSDCPCYSCLYPEQGEDVQTCSESGVLAPVVGVIGSMQALEAIKLICKIGEPLYGRLLLFDALSLQWRSMNFKKDPHCPVCGTPDS
ncbi:MAG: molybdopterin-synthase adenylyltransferase MoeB [Gammaproteobacteria bacterium]|nr:molybdopterin-synthase adenylyltransferase MoeB [Gammaproteobacteria bacterium]